jgi:hypothetical protein
MDNRYLEGLGWHRRDARDITPKVMPMGLDAISRLNESLSPGVFEDNPEPEV